MPFKTHSNNRLLPANARAADVAERAVREIIPIQQRRYYDAFRVQGITAIHYNRLASGRKCSCQSARKQINGLLDREGKASLGTINGMLTGQLSASFEVTPYNFDQEALFPGATANNETSPGAPTNKNQGVFDIVTEGEMFPFADVQIPGADTFGDNGPSRSVDIDALAGDFEPDYLGYSEVACPICFGSGFIGGYSTYHGHRSVSTVTDVQLVEGEVALVRRPLSATVASFNQVVVLPRGAIGIDVFRVWNLNKPVTVDLYLDGLKITNVTQVLSKCDGKPHILNAQTSNGAPFEFTHFEMQFVTSTEPVYFEFPKRPGGSDTSLLEQQEPFQIILSPNVPVVSFMDVIVESQQGKTLIVQNDNPWQSRNRNVLGWEIQVRVVQPQELFRLLPVRGRVMTKDATTMMTRDNSNGPRRT